MLAVAYSSPWVPPEWIAAHGMEPSYVQLHSAGVGPLLGASRGVCPYAGALVDAALCRLRASALVMTTACDQMRYAAALVASRGSVPVFLMNVPSTWQSPVARQMYKDEIERLGRFLERLGGRKASHDDLPKAMGEYDRARALLREAAPRLSGRQLAEAVSAIRGSLSEVPVPRAGPTQPPGIPLAMLGGPLVAEDYAILDLVEHLGGRVVLDGTEGGERTLPAPFDPQRTAAAPLEELVDAYFLHIPDVFRRPNDALYDWLGQQLAARSVRGILLRRYVWCDLWHAELYRLRAFSPVPVLEIDVAHDDPAAAARIRARIEPFLEILR